MRIFLIGFMGAGKSYWGARLSEIAGLNFIDLDQHIEKQCACKISDLFSEKGEEGFRILESKTLQDLIYSEDDFVMACGGGTPCFFTNLELMKQYGKVVWLNASVQTIVDRLVTARSHRPLLAKLEDKQLEEFVTATLHARQFYYAQADITVDCDTLEITDLLKKIIDG